MIARRGGQRGSCPCLAITATGWNYFSRLVGGEGGWRVNLAHLSYCEKCRNVWHTLTSAYQLAELWRVICGAHSSWYLAWECYKIGVQLHFQVKAIGFGSANALFMLGHEICWPFTIWSYQQSSIAPSPVAPCDPRLLSSVHWSWCEKRTVTISS